MAKQEPKTVKVKEEKVTKCYTYEVRMIVQVISDDDEQTARTKLDKEGGYVTKRDVTLADAVSLYSGVDK
jgi:hypothetical protein